jgi:tryptophanyl-tRNA synthetase
MRNSYLSEKDQLQHLEMTRDVGARFNHKMGETFVLPQDFLQDDTKIIPGTDGNKMSKSRDNVINIFLDDKALRKQVMGIQTDSKALEDPKDPETCNVFALYQLLANPDEIAEMRSNYTQGGYGYGHAKQALYEVILRRFSDVRERYAYYMANNQELNRLLLEGAEKARSVARTTLARVREKIGY